MNSPKRLATCLLPTLLATATSAGPLILPAYDRVDGQIWRGDQFHPTLVSREGTTRTIDGVRWGFTYLNASQGTWKANPIRARIDGARVGRVYLVIDPFSVAAHHASLLFEFPDGGFEPADPGTTPRTSRGLIVTLEGRIPAGQSYEYVAAARGRYEMVYNLASWEDFRQQCVDIYRQPLELHPLELDPARGEPARLLELALQESLRNHRGERYWLFAHNCTTVLADWIRVVLAGRGRGAVPESLGPATPPAQAPPDPSWAQRVFVGRMKGWLVRHGLIASPRPTETYRPAPAGRGFFGGG